MQFFCIFGLFHSPLPNFWWLKAPQKGATISFPRTLNNFFPSLTIQHTPSGCPSQAQTYLYLCRWPSSASQIKFDNRVAVPCAQQPWKKCVSHAGQANAHVPYISDYILGCLSCFCVTNLCNLILRDQKLVSPGKRIQFGCFRLRIQCGMGGANRFGFCALEQGLIHRVISTLGKGISVRSALFKAKSIGRYFQLFQFDDNGKCLQTNRNPGHDGHLNAPQVFRNLGPR